MTRPIPDAKPPVVYVVDDDASIRRVLRHLFESEQLTCVTAASAARFFERYDAAAPGCLLLDMRMPETSGLELQADLRARGIDLPVIFMTGHADVPTSVRAMKGGAIDFIEKPFNEQALLEAVNRALQHDTARRRTEQYRAAIVERVASLTHRERQVLELVVAGQTNRQIAEQWGLSEKTIKAHRGQVMEKMGADTIPELVLLAQAAGISPTNVLDD